LEHIIGIIMADDHSSDNAVEFLLVFFNDQIKSKVFRTFLLEHYQQLFITVFLNLLYFKSKKLSNKDIVIYLMLFFLQLLLMRPLQY